MCLITKTRLDSETETLIPTTGGGFDVAQPISFGAQMSNPQTDVNMVQTLQAKNPMAVAFATEQTPKASSDVAFTITKGSPSGGGHPQAAMTAAMQVRRLTPRECERLQGFTDDYTAIPYRNKLASDDPRYKALGNSMAVPVMRWIGQRIQMVKDIE